MIMVSVVIPVYNAGAHLDRCIASLLAQTVECEFIFVNDGSKDESQAIIEKFRETDNRIVLINQENQGVSAARNAGIAVAKGEYVGFVDADDFVDADMFGRMYNVGASHNADIVISDFYLQQQGKEHRTNYDFPKETVFDADFIAEKLFPYFIGKESMNNIFNKIFRRSIIENHKIDFPKGVPLGEDAIFNMKVFAVCESAYYLDYSGYHYLEIPGSATRNIATHDYFGRIVETFHFDYKAILPLEISDSEYETLKEEKFINSVLSLVHLYFGAREIGIGKKFKAVRRMMKSPETIEILQRRYNDFAKSYDRYSRFLLKCIKNKDIYSLYLAVSYSRFRNR